MFIWCLWDDQVKTTSNSSFEGLSAVIIHHIVTLPKDGHGALKIRQEIVKRYPAIFRAIS